MKRVLLEPPSGPVSLLKKSVLAPTARVAFETDEANNKE